ncbi:hypothetical protein RRG08_039638 [Elysia crispata]|uniref:Uncharacterized protein n=1 Tax=Elysia crispata TaxID=231223 RepID=A0AAE0Y9U7_9GAST|nr:hypothetical protein RRG08_039638 [Elysia crispata]
MSDLNSRRPYRPLLRSRPVPIRSCSSQNTKSETCLRLNVNSQYSQPPNWSFMVIIVPGRFLSPHRPKQIEIITVNKNIDVVLRKPTQHGQSIG